MQGFFARPRALLQRQLQRAQRRVVLQNGVETQSHTPGVVSLCDLSRIAGQSHAAAHHYGVLRGPLEDMSCTSDALAVECTHLIDLQALPLPVGRDAFTAGSRSTCKPCRRSCPSIPSPGPCPGACWWPRSRTGSGTNGCRRRSRAIVSSRAPLCRATRATWSGTRRLRRPPSARPPLWPCGRGRAPRSWSKKNCAWA